MDSDGMRLPSTREMGSGFQVANVRPTTQRGRIMDQIETIRETQEHTFDLLSRHEHAITPALVPGEDDGGKLRIDKDNEIDSTSSLSLALDEMLTRQRRINAALDLMTDRVQL